MPLVSADLGYMIIEESPYKLNPSTERYIEIEVNSRDTENNPYDAEIKATIAHELIHILYEDVIETDCMDKLLCQAHHISSA